MEAISIYASRGVSFSEIICHCSTVRFLLSQKLLKPLGAVFQDIGDAAAYDPAWARWSRGERRERSIPWVVLLRPQRLGSHHQAGTWAPLCRDISQNYINCNQSLWEYYYASKQSATQQQQQEEGIMRFMISTTIDHMVPSFPFCPLWRP